MAQGSLRELVVELLDTTHLVDVEFLELSAARPENLNDAEVDSLLSFTEGEIRHDFDMNFSQTKEHDLLRVRIRLQTRSKWGHVTAEAAAVYGLTEPRKLDPSLAVEFVNRVAVMAVLPYLREAVHGISLKVLGEPHLMPIIPAGSITFSVTDETEQSST